MRYNSTEFVWLDVAIRTLKEDCDVITNTIFHNGMYNILINYDNNFLWRGGVLIQNKLVDRWFSIGKQVKINLSPYLSIKIH